MSLFKSYISGGIKRAEYGFYDANGLFCGAVTSLANGEDSGAKVWYGMKSVDATFAEPDRQTQTGDDQRQGTITFESTDPTTLAIQMGVRHLTDEAALQGVNVYDEGQFEVLPIDPFIDERPPAALIVHATGKKRAVGERPVKGYEVHVFNYGEISAQGFDGLTERELRNYDYFMSLDQVFNYPWGRVLTIADDGTKASSGGVFTSESFVSLHAIRGDASALAVTLDWTPIGAETVAGVVEVYKTAAADGVVTKLTPTTDFTLAADGSFALTVAGQGLAGDHFVVRYKHTGAATS